MSELRSGQKTTVQAIKDYIYSDDKRPGIIVAPTAFGKSYVIGSIPSIYDKPILVLQPSIELLKQNYEKLLLLGGKAEIYSAGAGSKKIGHITYATLASIKNDAHLFREAGVELVIIDECHDGYKPDPDSMFRVFIDELKPKKVVGLTASPFRLKNNRNGSRLVLLNRMRPMYFKHFIHITQISEMRQLGYWTPSVDEYWEMDESSLVFNTTGADFTEESMKEYIKVNGVNNKIYLRIKNLLESGERKSILAFVDTAESCAKFCEYLPDSAYLTAKTKKKERAQIIADFKSGKIKVLFNYNILSTGFDHPGVDCVIMGRPTNSLAIFYQIYGRGSRILEGKKDFLFIDCGMNFKRLAHPASITIENFQGHGWAVFAGEKLVTGVILGTGYDITKNDLRGNYTERVDDTFFEFGKYQGKALTKIAVFDIGYLIYMAGQDIDPTLKKKIQNVLKVNELQKMGVKLQKSGVPF